MFKKYPKIHRLGKEETDGILFGEVHVEEKIDGANASIWMEDGAICIGSRNNKLTSDVLNPKEGDNYFNGFLEYVAGHEGIQSLLKDSPDLRLCGEWLVKHSIAYDSTKMNKFYLFDITTATDEEGEEEYLPKFMVHKAGRAYDIETPEYHGSFENPTLEQIMEFVGKSAIGDEGEGVVLKNPKFVNVFGDHCYGKIVTENFKEKNGIVFGGNNKHSDSYCEMWIANKYITLARVEKVMQKLQPTLDRRLHLQHIPLVIKAVYQDMLTEEIWEIVNNLPGTPATPNPTIKIKTLNRIVSRKIVQIYKDILNNSISVADQFQPGLKQNQNVETNNDEGASSIGEIH